MRSRGAAVVSSRRLAFMVLLVASLGPARRGVGQSLPCAIDTTAAWASVSRTWSNERGVRWSNDSLRLVLLAMQARDQSAREEFGQRVGDTLYGRKLIDLDSALAAEMTSILDRYGLPTRDLVGPAGSDAAMLIVQHSWSLQERVLESARAVLPGQISPEKLAMLEDRVLVHRGEPQRWGTQFTLGPDGVFRFAPIADAVGLDARRAAAGMPPMSLYVCLLEEAGMRVDHTSLPPPLRP